MSTITTRSGKGSPLTHAEVDANFNNLNTDKIEDGDSPSFVNVTVTGTVDGRDIATDGTKLDGIESGADVTDTTNVTAAGALMDSELASLTSVKLLNQGVATTDSPTFAGLSVSSSSTYAINVTRPTAGNTTLRINSGSTAGNDAIFRADIGNTTGSSGVYFGDTDTNGIGRIMYEHNGDYMRFYTSSAEQMRITSAGNVGIGLTNPANTLEVNGAIVAVSAASSYTNTGLYLQNKGSSVFDVGAWRSGASIAELSFSTDSGSDAAPVERMRIDSSGNVGIGTSSPDYQLTVYDGTSSAIGIKSGTTGQSALNLGDNGNIDVGQLLYDHTSNYLAITVNASESMRITSAGNVGIGTTNPSAPLTVAGNIATDKQTISSWGATNTRALELTTYGAVSSNDSVGTAALSCNAYESADDSWNRVAATSAALYQQKYNGEHVWSQASASTAGSAITWTEQMRINSTGNVGIGTSSPAYKFVVSSGGASGIEFGPAYSGTSNLVQHYSRSGAVYVDAVNVAAQHRFLIGASEAVRINSSGNVGIGTSSPSRNLEISSTGPAIRLTDNNSTGSAMTGFVEWYDSTATASALIGFPSTTNPDFSVSNYITGGDLKFNTETTERMRIAAGGNVGIGTASPGEKLHVAGNIEWEGRIAPQGTAYNGSASSPTICPGYDYDTGFFLPSSNNIGITCAGSETARFNGAGDLFINTTTLGVQNADAICIDRSVGRLYLNTTGTSGLLFCNQSYADTALRYQIVFYRNESLIGSIRSDTSGTTYFTSSDYRLKENLNAISNGIDRVKQLNPLRFNFIANPEKTVDGFLAHEVDLIVPEAIAGEKDAVDENGNIDPQQIDQAKLVPLLTAALKESIAKIEALEARVATLENN